MTTEQKQTAIDDHPVHPWYGPCDGMRGGKCYECYKVKTEKLAAWLTNRTGQNIESRMYHQFAVGVGLEQKTYGAFDGDLNLMALAEEMMTAEEIAEYEKLIQAAIDPFDSLLCVKPAIRFEAAGQVLKLWEQPTQ